MNFTKISKAYATMLVLSAHPTFGKLPDLKAIVEQLSQGRPLDDQACAALEKLADGLSCEGFSETRDKILEAVKAAGPEDGAAIMADTLSKLAELFNASEPAEPAASEPAASEPAASEPAASEPAEPAAEPVGDYLPKQVVIDAIRETVAMRAPGAEAWVVDPDDIEFDQKYNGVEGFLAVRHSPGGVKLTRAMFEEGLKRSRKARAKNPPTPDYLEEKYGFPLKEINDRLQEEFGAKLVAADHYVGLQAVYGRGSLGVKGFPALHIVGPTDCDVTCEWIAARAVEMIGDWAIAKPDWEFWVARGKHETWFSNRCAKTLRFSLKLSHTVWPSIGNLVASMGAGSMGFATDGERFYESPMGRLLRNHRVVVLDPSMYSYEAVYSLVESFGWKADIVLPGAGEPRDLARRLNRYSAAAAERGACFPIIPAVYGLGFYPLDVTDAGALIAFTSLRLIHHNKWAGAGAGAELAAELAGGSEYPSFPKIFPDKKFVLPMHRTMISDLAIELCERLADGKTGTLSWQYFKLPIDADVWAGYCENGGVSFAVTASGVRQILNSFVAMIKKTVRVINMPGTNQLLFSGKASGFHVRHEKAKARAESWIAAATKYLLEGDGSEGPLFFAPPAAPWNSDDFDDDVAATAYTCPGFPYGYMGNDFDLQL